MNGDSERAGREKNRPGGSVGWEKKGFLDAKSWLTWYHNRLERIR